MPLALHFQTEHRICLHTQCNMGLLGWNAEYDAQQHNGQSHDDSSITDCEWPRFRPRQGVGNHNKPQQNSRSFHLVGTVLLWLLWLL